MQQTINVHFTKDNILKQSVVYSNINDVYIMIWKKKKKKGGGGVSRGVGGTAGPAPPVNFPKPYNRSNI